MISSSVTRLTRQLTNTHFSSVTARVAGNNVFPAAASATLNTVGLPFVSCQTFATNRKVIDAKNVRRLKIQAKKKKTTNKTTNKPVRFFSGLQFRVAVVSILLTWITFVFITIDWRRRCTKRCRPAIFAA
jgi:hypothetical protein